jgi:hypothetical protein
MDSRPAATAWTCASPKPGVTGPPAELDHAGPRSARAPDIAVLADGDDPAVTNRDRPDPASRRVHGLHAAAEEDEVGAAHRRWRDGRSSVDLDAYHEPS